MVNQVIALVREKTGKGAIHRLRKNGRIPAVLYGDGQSSTMLLSVDAREFMKRLGHGGTNQLLQLRIEDSERSQALSAMLKEIQKDPLWDVPLHIDFVAVKMDHEVHIRVPLHVVGEQKRVKDGTVIEQLMHELDISCLPLDIPERIEVNVSGLEMGDTLCVKDLHVREGIKIRSRPDESVVTTVMPVKVGDLESLSPEKKEEPVAAG